MAQRYGPPSDGSIIPHILEDAIAADLTDTSRPIGAAVGAGFVTRAEYENLLARVNELYAGDGEAGLPTAEQVAAQQTLIQDGLARIAWQPFDALHRGDSITDGHGAETQTTDGNTGYRWVDLFRDRMRARFQPAGIAGGGGYVPAGAAYTNVSTGGGVYSAGWVLNPTTGVGIGGISTALGETAARLDAEGETASLTFMGTGVAIPYTEYATNNSQLTVTIDGVTVETPVFEQNRTNVKVYDGLTAGEHTIVFSHGAGTTEYRIHGAMILNGDADAGYRTWGAGRSGATTPSNTSLSEMISYVGPHLVTLYWGTNEYRNNVTPATFKATLSTQVQHHRDLAPEAGLVLIRGYEPAHTGTPVAPWADYRNAVKEVAAEKGIILVDLADYFGEGIPGTDLSSDGVHPNAAGHALIDQAVWDATGLENATVTPVEEPAESPIEPVLTALSLPTDTSYAQTAASTELQAAQTLDIRITGTEFTHADWVSKKIANRYVSGAAVWQLVSLSTGFARFTVTTPAYPSGVTYTSTATLPAPSSVNGLRLTFDAPGKSATFYVGDGAGGWTQLGAVVTSTYESTLQSFDTPVSIGNNGSSGGVTGTIGGFEILSSDGATTYLSEDFTDGDATGWTLEGGATLA